MSTLLFTEALSHQVTTSSGPLEILKNINFTVEQGQSVAIIGASGSGKSTLLSMLAGLDQPSSGKVYIDNHEIAELDEEARADIRKKYVAFVFQNFQLLSGLNALENVALPLEVSGTKNANERARDFLQRVGLENRVSHMPNQLSGGEQQRVALARAFACEAPIIFADEPTGNLDSHTGERITDLLFDLNKAQTTTLVLVTHSSTLAQKCDRIFKMAAGEIQEV